MPSLRIKCRGVNDNRGLNQTAAPAPYYEVDYTSTTKVMAYSLAVYNAGPSALTSLKLGPQRADGSFTANFAYILYKTDMSDFTQAVLNQGTNLGGFPFGIHPVTGLATAPALGTSLLLTAQDDAATNIMYQYSGHAAAVGHFGAAWIDYNMHQFEALGDVWPYFTTALPLSQDGTPIEYVEPSPTAPPEFRLHFTGLPTDAAVIQWRKALPMSNMPFNGVQQFTEQTIIFQDTADFGQRIGLYRFIDVVHVSGNKRYYRLQRKPRFVSVSTSAGSQLFPPERLASNFTTLLGSNAGKSWYIMSKNTSFGNSRRTQS